MGTNFVDVWADESLWGPDDFSDVGGEDEIVRKRR